MSSKRFWLFTIGLFYDSVQRDQTYGTYISSNQYANNNKTFLLYLYQFIRLITILFLFF